jgi:hypothetical protein
MVTSLIKADSPPSSIGISLTPAVSQEEEGYRPMSTDPVHSTYFTKKCLTITKLMR